MLKTWFEALSYGRATLRVIPWSFGKITKIRAQFDPFAGHQLHDGDPGYQSEIGEKS